MSDWFIGIEARDPHAAVALISRETLAAELELRVALLKTGGAKVPGQAMVYGGRTVTWHAVAFEDAHIVEMGVQARARDYVVNWADSWFREIRDSGKFGELKQLRDCLEILERSKYAEAAASEHPSTQLTPALPPSPA